MANHSTQSPAADAPDGAQASLVVPDLCTVTALSVLVLVGELLAVVLFFAGQPITWMRFALLSLFVQWVALLTAGGLCWLRRWLPRFSLPAGATLALALVLGVTALVGLASDRLLAGGIPGVPIDGRAIAGQLIIAGIIALLALRYFHVQQQLRIREQAELKSRIQALQSRIRPHFLFNSMNIIASLIETDPRTAESVVEDLAELFRASLNDAGHQVPLADELALCERYLRIEQLRLGDRLRLEWRVAPIPVGVGIPLLTLQPLLENAIYHGIQPLPEGGTVSLDVTFEGDRVRVEVTNPLAPVAPGAQPASETQGNRMAVANIRARLEALHGAAARLDSGPEGACYVTRLWFPCSSASAGRA